MRAALVRVLGLTTWIAVGSAGCADDPESFVPTRPDAGADAGHDGGVDASTPPVVGIDGGLDASLHVVDAASDAAELGDSAR